ncbi:RNA polymerase sigma factor [Sutcliffiella rhizosphaerae]|uniref:ECF RNA polymerase sigma factor SigH n=1 Tax=Sutcliffiella rhizosphaerae TaxID=2880967 RepID=A0ABN8A8Q5_9BACI|nr:RNA polymerase sigma factor [Sutcliffiella rhizosphaerae]CAG9621479.1 ECF RNA polymerase sigma factor SigH [Sutcliffiella rhizosphaerae]
MDFTIIYQRYYERVYTVSYSIIRDRQLAEDNVQETFIKAYKKISALESIEKIGAWLSVIATRTAIDFFRKEKKTKSYPMEIFMLDQLGSSSDWYVDEEIEAGLMKELIQESMEIFQPEEKKLLLLKWDKGWKEKEIAEAMDMNPSTVKTKIHRAKRKLKERLMQDYKVA